MNTKEALDILTLMMDEMTRRFGVSPSPRLALNSRLRTTAGVCRILQKDNQTLGITIELNPRYLIEFGFERMRSTFLHEMAHAICWSCGRDHGHSAYFKRICRELGGSLPPSMGGGETRWRTEPYRWVYTCPGCGANLKRKRRFASRVRRSYRCGRCGERLDRWREARLHEA